MEFYVYAYLDPRKPGIYKYDDLHFDFEPFYIGKGKGRRFYQHLINYKKRSTKNKHYDISAKIGEIVNNSYYPIIIKIMENLCEKSALQIEEDIIRKIGRLIDNKGPLTNIAIGNSSPSFSGYKWKNPMPIESRIKISKKMKELNSGKSNPMFGKTGACNPKYGTGKKIYQYDIFGNLIMTWGNSNIISESTNFDRHAIDNRCKKISNKHYMNYFWSYESSPDPNIIPLSRIIKIEGIYHVYSYSKNFIGKFNSIREISRSIKIPRNVLSYYIKDMYEN